MCQQRLEEALGVPEAGVASGPEPPEGGARTELTSSEGAASASNG